MLKVLYVLINFMINKELYVLQLNPAIPFLISEIAENIENSSVKVVERKAI